MRPARPTAATLCAVAPYGGLMHTLPIVYSAETICVGLARVGSESQRIVCGTMEQLRHVDFGPPLHSLILAGQLHYLEADMLRAFAVDPSTLSGAEGEAHGDSSADNGHCQHPDHHPVGPK